LTIDNTADNWLTALFTAEYAGQFDVFLPALAQLGLPLPLGGSSNHFRTTTLRAIGAWDPYNVTEDADLGLRLARFGYRSGMIERSTYEEAPARLGPWLRQRTRWFKGWMQTVNVCGSDRKTTGFGLIPAPSAPGCNTAATNYWA
jgi:glycosyltransferase XagB